ncbi:acyl-CoA dehydrogenase family protein [Burkholderia sp. Bp9143]|uniref:acyl-CoA dehydrogenase family protein n=1 Tax=Burkholderia sp. Bp9143 TaxID=2184574 RepID=UPI000F5A62A2|nr:acyl-CoA dehydrogenase family protein [Burkholderia sp. Bp9143]
METSDISLDAESKSIIERALNRFIDETYEPSARRARLNRADLDYRTYWPMLAELGVLGLSVSSDCGGIGADSRDVCDMLYVLGRGLLLEPLIEGTVIAGAVLTFSADSGIMLPAMVSGEKLTVLVGGRKGDDLRFASTGLGYELSGIARVVPGAAQADIWLIPCVDEGGVWRILRVTASAAAARVLNYRMMDGREACDVGFESMVVSPSDVMLEGPLAESAMAAASAAAVSAYAAEAAGVMHNLVSITSDYLRTREQFGVHISSFQALQHRLANMHMAALEARAMSRAMAKSVDEALDKAQSDRIRWLRYAVPSVIARCSACVGHDAIQMHGGMGVTDELIVSHCNSRLVVLSKLLERWSTGSVAVVQAMN